MLLSVVSGTGWLVASRPVLACDRWRETRPRRISVSLRGCLGRVAISRASAGARRGNRPPGVPDRVRVELGSTEVRKGKRQVYVKRIVKLCAKLSVRALHAIGRAASEV